MLKKLRKRKENLNARNTSHGTANTEVEVKKIPRLFLWISIVSVVPSRICRAPNGGLEVEDPK
jgi:hypothetical protein